jgi:hypothetical protein
VERTIPVGESPVETDGPHGLATSSDGRHLYMTTAHGIPDGKLWKFEMGPDTLVAPPILLGSFPATLDLTPDGLYAFVVNFNLHGEHVPSSVSVVYTPSMVEVDQIPTCTMPHGMRVSPDGLFAYSMCMMDDQLVEVDTRTFEVSRRFSVSQGREGALHDYAEPELTIGPLGMRDTPPAGGGAMGGHGSRPSRHGADVLSYLGPAVAGRAAGLRGVQPEQRDPRGRPGEVGARSALPDRRGAVQPRHDG